MKFLKRALLIVLLLLLIVGGLLLKTFYDAGEFKQIGPSTPGPCDAIEGVLSSEDITVHPKTGMAFISSDDRRSRANGKKGRQGAIFGYDLESDNPKLINLTVDFEREFCPHGIGLLIDKDGKVSLFVVNHAGGSHFIEIFDYRGTKLIHRESIEDPLMHSPNDVIPVGPRAFYVTNDHGSTSEFIRTLEDYLRLARAYVLYYDGKNFSKVAEDLGYANGINLSGDGKAVYIAATIDAKIHIFKRNQKTGALAPREAIDLGTGVDNIELDDDGNLWIGAHPKLLTFVKHSKDSKIMSPSQVLKVTIEKTDKYLVEEVFLSKGEKISGSSVAAVYKNKLLIGSVFDPRFLICELQ